ncbi:MAG: Crp/Fnr family transcriptional regulator [Pseudomonadota bacterium]
MKVFRKKNKKLSDFLSEDVLEVLYAAGREQSYDDGEMIQQRGDKWRGISIVQTGEAIAANVGRDGSIVPSALIKPGDTFGEFTTFLDLPRSHTIFANGRTKIRHIKRDRFLALIEAEPAISQAMLTLTLERNYELVSNLDSNRRLSLPARVARLLIAEFDKTEKAGTIVCRQEDLAFMIGVSRVAVGKALDKLAAQSLIETGYGKIHVPDTVALKKYLRRQDPLSST